MDPTRQDPVEPATADPSTPALPSLSEGDAQTPAPRIQEASTRFLNELSRVFGAPDFPRHTGSADESEDGGDACFTWSEPEEGGALVAVGRSITFRQARRRRAPGEGGSGAASGR